MANHLLSLSTEDREMRFSMTGVSDGYVQSYVGKINFERDIILAMRNAAGEIVALAEVFPALTSCEAAFSVEPQRRGKGLAATLVQLAIDVATAIGATVLHAQCVSRNVSMRRLFTHFRMRVETDAGEVVATLLLPAGHRQPANDTVAGLMGFAA
jgi:RimJ/RimL family protein N-acetyltransferase